LYHRKERPRIIRLQPLTDEKLADKFDATDKAKLEGAVNDTIKWLDASQEGSREEYEEKQKELESIAKVRLF
jgi:L1 cell adhesion molecule like protein